MATAIIDEIASGDPVRNATNNTWLSIDPTTIKSTDLTKEHNMIREKSSLAMGKVASNADDFAPMKDESVWTEYNKVNPKVTAKLKEIALVSPKI
jgi:hypothetical protein